MTLFCVMFSTVKATEVEIGDPDNAGTNTYLPCYTLYNYGWTQQIYTAEEIGQAGTINSLTLWLYHTAGASATPLTIKIYMMAVSKESFESTTDWVAMTESDLVYSGTLTVTHGSPAQEYTFELDAPFAYNGTDNLLIAFANNTGSYKSYLTGLVYDGEANSAMYIYQDSQAYDISNPGTAKGRLAKKNVIMLDMTTSGGGPTCDKPESVEANDVTANSATINWIGTAAAYNLQYKGASDEDWTLVKNLSGTSYALSNLASNTAYQVQVQAICGENTSAWKSVSFRTLIALPYAEHFDGTSAPNGWTNTAGLLQPDGSVTLSGTTGWSFGTKNDIFDSHAYVNIWSTNVYRWLISPAIPIPAMEENDPGFQLSFQIALTKWSSATEVDKTQQQDDRFIVLVSNDNGANWTILREWNNTGSAYVYNDIAVTGEEVAPIDLSAYAGQTILLAFYGESTASGGDNAFHLDDVIVEKIPTCLKPTGLHALDAQATSTTLPVAWTANSGETAWRLQYKPTADAQAEWITLDIAANPYTITGLNAFAEYEIRVAAVCTEEDFTDYGKSIRAKTAAVVPFLQTFDTTAMPGEWKRYEALLENVQQSGAELEATQDGWKVGAQNGVFNNEHLYLNIKDSTDYWLVSPVIEMQEGYQLTFDLALTTTNGAAVTAGEQNDDKFIVFISTDGGANWIELNKWDNAGAGTSFDQINTEGQTVKFELNDFAGQSIMLAFYGESTEANGDNNLHISNVAIDLIPACERPLSITFGTITGTTAQVTWDADGDGLWEYGYKANPAASFEPVDADYTYSTSNKFADLSELAETTDYIFFVRRACGETEKSEPLMKAFKTLQTPASLPYDGDFEEANGWLLVNGEAEIVNKWAWGTATAKTGTHALYISNDNGLTNAYTFGSYSEGYAPAMVYATKTFYFGETGMYSFSFDWKCQGAGSTDYMRVALAPISVDPEAATTVPTGFSGTALPEGWIALDGGSKLNLSSDWQNQLAEINIENVGNYKVIIAWRNDNSSGTNPPAAIDNFKISRIICTRPTGLTVSDITSSGASFAWDEESDGMTWVYAIAPDTVAEPADEAFLPVEQNSITLDELNYNTSYVFYLRKNCEADGFSQSRTIAFKTLNPYLVVINEHATSTNLYVPFYSYYVDQANQSQFVVPADSLLRMEWDTITQISFYTSSTTYATADWGDALFEVYMAEAPSASISAFANWDDLTKVKNAASLALVDQVMTITLDQPYVYQGGHLLIGFKQTVAGDDFSLSWYGKSLTGAAMSAYGTSGTQTQRNFLPRVAFDIIPGDAPACAKPGNLVAIDSTATTTSIELDWIPAGLENYWFVQYKKSADAEWSYAADSVKAHPFVLTGLEPSLDYDVRVAAWCNLEDSTASDYCAVVSFRTRCVSVTSLDEDFDGIEGSTSSHVLPICWQSINTTTYSSYAYYPTVYKGASSANTPDNYLRFYSYYYPSSSTDYDPQDQYAILPEIENISGLRLKLNARKYSASYDATFYVGIMTDPEDTATFVPIDTLAPVAAEYEQFIVPFDSYLGAGKYIAIKMKHAEITTTSSYRSVYIDDVVVEPIPSCLEPKDLMVVDTTITINSAVFKWTVQGSETEWIFQYKKHADEEWTTVPALRADSFLLTGLESTAVYDARVAAKCSESENSSYTDVISFATQCEPWSIAENGEYVEGFEAYEGVAYNANGVTPLCWETGGTSTYADPHVVAKGQYAYVHDGNQALNFCASSSSYQYAVLPEFVEPLNTLQISFWTQMESTSNGTLYLGYFDAESNFHQLTAYENAGSMANYESMLDTVPAEAVRLAFVWNHSGTSYYSCCIDDVKVSFIPSCLKPNTVSVDSVSAHLAKISWKAGEEGQTAWQIAYDTIASSQPDTLANVIDVTDSVYVANGLLAEKMYYAYVRTNCGGVYSAWTNAVSFTTSVACPAPTALTAELTMGNGTVATLKWKAGREETAWILEYSLNADMTDSIAIEVADTMYNFEGLTPETTYYARVKADCGDIDGKSLYSDVISFKPTNALSLTICDSTATNEYVPVYGFYVDNYSMSQFIVPADSLASMQWGSIDGLTFYASTSSVAWNNAKFEVYVAEVPSTTISAFADWASLEKVMNEAHLQITNGKMVVAFDAPYIYQGGNLLIGIKQTVYGSYTRAYWYGVDATGASYGGYLSKSGTTPTASQRNFLPKMTISYLAGSAPECMFVSGLQVTATTANSATIGWTAEEGQDAWQLVYSTNAEFDPNEATPVEAASNPYVLGGLTPETSYTVYVRANCGEDGFSAWSKALTFTTASSCQMPDDLEASDIMPNSAVISWNTYGQTGFNLRYSADAQNWTVIENAEMPCTITGLTAATKYYVQVQVTCGDLTQWSQYITVKTECEPWSIALKGNYVEGFESYTGATYSAAGVAPDCWDVAADATVKPHVIGSGSYYYKHDGTKALTFYGNGNCFAALPEFEEALNRLQISFWMQTESASNGVLTLGYITAADEGDFATFHPIVDYDRSYGAMTQHETMLDTLPAQAYRLAFRWNYSGQYSCCIDDIIVSFLPTCFKPTGLTASDVFARSAKLNWTAAEGQNAWEIALDTIAAFNPDTLQSIITVAENPFTLTNLLPSHTYYVYVRANCGETDGVSVWTAKQSFRTTVACPAPTGLAAELTPGNGSIATLTWNAGEAQAWQVEYSLNSDMSDSIAIFVTEPVANLTGLTAEATYYARVKADCGELDGQSVYSATISFVPTNIYSIVVNDGTQTNNYVPIHGSYVDEGNTASQFIVPAESLQEILWDSITELTFYASQASVDWGAAEFEVYMTTAEDAALAALNDWDNLTQVMVAGNLSIVDNKMVVTLSEPFQYTGDNLLIGFKQTVAGEWKAATWYGKNTTGASIGGYGTGNNMTQRNFLPKMTIAYVPGQAPSCMWATHLEVSEITAVGATFAWDSIEGANWEYAVVLAESNEAPTQFAPAANPLVLDNLEETTAYIFYLRNNCEVENSKLVSVAFTTIENVQSIPYSTQFADASGWKMANSENAWVINNNRLFISNDGVDYAYDESETSVSFATKLFDFDSTTVYTVSYEWMCEGEWNDEDGALDYLRVALVPAAVELTAGVQPEGLTEALLPAGWIALDGDSALTRHATWQTVAAEVTVAAGQYRLAFIWINDESGADGDPAAIRNLSIAKGTITGIESGAGFGSKAVKFIKNNQVYILVNGNIYDAIGRKIK